MTSATAPFSWTFKRYPDMLRHGGIIMNTDIHFLGISGSLRQASRNSGLLRCAAQCLPQNVHFQMADLSAIPFYNADIAHDKPAAVQTLIEQATQAHAFVLACPEYNYSLAPALKNALDWLSREPDLRPISGKAVAIMGAGGGMGTARAQYHLRQVCVYLNLHPLNKPEIFSNAFSSSFSENGDVADPLLRQRVADLMKALLEWHAQLAK